MYNRTERYGIGQCPMLNDFSPEKLLWCALGKFKVMICCAYMSLVYKDILWNEARHDLESAWKMLSSLDGILYFSYQRKFSGYICKQAPGHLFGTFSQQISAETRIWDWMGSANYIGSQNTGTDKDFGETDHFVGVQKQVSRLSPKTELKDTF